MTPQSEAPEMVKEANTEAMFEAQMNKFFGDDEDFEDGEKRWLAKMVSASGTTMEDIMGLQKMNAEDGGIGYNMTGRQLAVWHIAAAEEKIDFAKVSAFSRATPKFPRSWVKGIEALDHVQIHKYMFSGSSAQAPKMRNRGWLDNFVATHFTDSDYFRVTDRASNRGVYDKTATGPKGFRPKSCGGSCMEYDETYWAAMCQSKFVVAPGGDAPWSYRFYETFLTHAIPLINSLETDWRARQSTKFIDKIGFTHMMTSGSLEYDKETAESNYRKAIKHLTFIEGDNAPEGWST